MRISESIAKQLADFGARHVFMFTGGDAMFLNDAIGYQLGKNCFFTQREQACAKAAEEKARMTNNPGVINFAGVYGAYTDSKRKLVISGQVKRETYLRCYYLPDLSTSKCY